MALHNDDDYVWGSGPKHLHVIETPYGRGIVYEGSPKGVGLLREMLGAEVEASIASLFMTDEKAAAYIRGAYSSLDVRLSRADDPASYFGWFGLNATADQFPACHAQRLADLAERNRILGLPLEGYSDAGREIRGGFDSLMRKETLCFPSLGEVVEATSHTIRVRVGDAILLLAKKNCRLCGLTVGRKLGVFVKRTPRGGFVTQYEGRWM